MKMLLVLTTATLVATALAQYAGSATAGQVGQPRPNARRSDGMGQGLIGGTVQALLARGTDPIDAFSPMYHR